MRKKKGKQLSFKTFLQYFQVFLTEVVHYDDRIVLPISYNHLYLLGLGQQKEPNKRKYIIETIFCLYASF